MIDMNSLTFLILHGISAIFLFLYSISLTRKIQDVSIGCVIMLFLVAILPFVNIFAVFVLGGYEPISKFLGKAIIRKNEPQ